MPRKTIIHKDSPKRNTDQPENIFAIDLKEWLIESTAVLLIPDICCSAAKFGDPSNQSLCLIAQTGK